MDARKFDALARWFDATAHRRAFGLLGATTLGGILGLSFLDDAEAKKKRRRKKKKCAPCRKKKKGKCKKHKPNGTPCGEGKICQGGSCVDIPCDPPCIEPATCIAGVCVFPDCEPACVEPETCVEGECVCPQSQTCGELCCPEAVFCEPDRCFCGDLICLCPGDEPACLGGQFGGCCLAEDSCDLAVGCVTEICSAQNDFNTLAWASCNDNPNCWCFSRFEGGSSVCADIGDGFSFCQGETSCENDDECAVGGVCVNISPSCPVPFGVCLTPCAAP